MHNEHYCEPYIEQSPYGIETGGMKWVGRAFPFETAKEKIGTSR